MQYRMSHILALLSLPMFVVAGSCDWTGNFSTGTSSGTATPTTESTSGSTEEDSTAHYSSFGIRTDAEEFEVISFKDVGLDRSDPTPTDPMLEAIAQSLAYQMNLKNELRLEPRVFRDETLADPSEHTHCEDHRVYVDVWRSESPDRWGYSLWSGCSAAQKFAVNEVPMEKPPESTDVSDAVEPLAREIADSLTAAVESDCFRRSC